MWGLGFEVWGSGFGVWGLGFAVEGFGFGVEGLSLDLPEAAEDRVAAGGVHVVGGCARRVHVRLPPNVPGNPAVSALELTPHLHELSGQFSNKLSS